MFKLKLVVLMLCVVSFTAVSPGMLGTCSVVCGDLDESSYVDGVDVEAMLAFLGGKPSDLNLPCIDSFTKDDYQDTADVLTWDYRLKMASTALNFCSWGVHNSSAMEGAFGGAPSSHSSSGGTGNGNSLLLGGKCNTSAGNFSLNDKLYVYNSQGSFVSNSFFTPIDTRANGRVTCGYDGKVYQLETDVGLTRLNDGVSVVTKGGIAVASDPRYSGSAVVYFGMQTGGMGEETEYAGRPILDAAIDAQGYIYVVPVTVVPDLTPTNAYLAAAKLQPLPGQTPCYSIVQVYDDAPGLNDDQDPIRIGLKEIEVDPEGTVYVTNANAENSSNFLWAYPTGGSTVKVALDTLSGVTGGIPDPTALCASKKYSLIYLASGQNSAEATSTNIYALSTTNLDLTLARTIQINGMGHVTGITENPVDGTIWVTGFKMVNIPNTANTSVPPFYHPYLAQVPANSDDPVTAASLESGTDIGMPLSITWMPANLVSSTPATNHTLWRNQKNTFRLYFDSNITTPAAGNIAIQEMQDNGQFGSDLSSGFTFTVENDGSSRPRILKIRETAQTLAHRKWYSVRNTGGWTGVANFEVQYQDQRGDANDDSYVTVDDYNYVWTSVTTLSCSDDNRKDIDGDGRITALDGSCVTGYKISNPVPKPSGH